VKRRNGHTPGTASHPGEILREELEHRGMTQTAFAGYLGIKDSYLSDIINGKRGVGVAMALRLERALGSSAEFWLGLQTNYDLAQARATERAGAKP
jgi:addiction module HigA family antidote